MAESITFNNATYIIPDVGESGWGQNLTNYFVAIPQGCYQLSGGTAPLTADLSFGSSFGLKGLYFTSVATHPALGGVIRLASGDGVEWRNHNNNGNLALSVDTSDNLIYNNVKVLISGAVVNADINASAAIAYSKLALTGSVVNADVASGAAIAYSKLTLTGSVVNADVGSSAAIAMSKLAALSTAKVLQTNSGTGFIEASAVTNTTLGYLDATSSIQTQLNAKQATLTAGQLPGATGNTAPSAGNVGQEIRSAVASGSGISSGGNDVYTDVTSITLSAGSWAISAAIEGVSTTTTVTLFQAGIGTASGNDGSGLVLGDNYFEAAPPLSTGFRSSICVPAWVQRVSGSTTYYLKFIYEFTSTAPKCFGRISAIRIN